MEEFGDDVEGGGLCSGSDRRNLACLHADRQNSQKRKAAVWCVEASLRCGSSFYRMDSDLPEYKALDSSPCRALAAVLCAVSLLDGKRAPSAGSVRGNSSGFRLQGSLHDAAPVLSGLHVQPLFHAFPYADSDSLLSCDCLRGSDHALCEKIPDDGRAGAPCKSGWNLEGSLFPRTFLLVHGDEPHEIRNRRSGSSSAHCSILSRQFRTGEKTDCLPS